MSNYQIIDAKNRKKLREILSSKGQALLPFLDAIERTEIAIDEVIDVAGRATIEAVLDLSAQSVAGEKHPGKKGSDVRWHGRQGGVVSLAERKLRVSRPRLRRKGKAEGGEVAIPAYEAVNNSSRLSQRIWEILMLGVSTRKYASVLPEMAETVGVSKSEVSREFVEASAEQLQGLMERPLDELEIAVVYLDGIRFGEHHALAAIGVGYRGIQACSGASGWSIGEPDSVQGAAGGPGRTRPEPRAVSAVRDRWLQGATGRRRRCVRYPQQGPALQEAQGAQCARLSAAGAEAASASEPCVRPGSSQQRRAKRGWSNRPKWLEDDYPSAAESIREGLDEMFTINELDLPASLKRCLGSTNIIESCFSGARGRTRRVTRWRNGKMVLRWAASALLATEKNFRRIIGYQSLPILEAKLAEVTENQALDKHAKVG